MADFNQSAYDAFRRDLARVFKTFNSSTQTDFCHDAATLTSEIDFEKSEAKLSELYLELD